MLELLERAPISGWKSTRKRRQRIVAVILLIKNSTNVKMLGLTVGGSPEQLLLCFQLSALIPILPLLPPAPALPLALRLLLHQLWLLSVLLLRPLRLPQRPVPVVYLAGLSAG